MWRDLTRRVADTSTKIFLNRQFSFGHPTRVAHVLGFNGAAAGGTGTIVAVYRRNRGQQGKSVRP